MSSKCKNAIIDLRCAKSCEIWSQKNDGNEGL